MPTIKVTIPPEEILLKYSSGYSLADIAREFDCSRERIRQLINKTGAYIKLVRRKSRKKENDPVMQFWKRVDRSGDCWVWTGAKIPKGYGHARWNGAFNYAHRISWILSYGPIPEGLEVCHHCDNPSCCNPDHLWLGTHAENMHDRDAKGRGRPWGREA